MLKFQKESTTAHLIKRIFFVKIIIIQIAPINAKITVYV